MLLKSAHIRHYKSMDDVVLNFENPLTLIVGPNASGKSNIIDALRFVRDALNDGLEHAVSSRDGITRIRQNSRTKPFKVSIALTFETTDEDQSTQLDYALTLKSLEGGNYVVESESGRLGSIPSSLASAFEGKPGASATSITLQRSETGSYTAVPFTDRGQAAQDQLALATGLGFIGTIAADSVPAFIRNWRYHSLFPNTLRELSTPDKDSQLNESGKNYASVIKQLKRSKAGKEALERVYETMRQVVPSFREVTVETAGGYLVPKFNFEVDEQTIKYDAIQLSDGTLRVFGLLLALYQVPAPQLLLIEEPEQNIQPGVLAVLADAFREASERTQIIVTTHSPNFVDHFKPEEIRVTALNHGLTTVAPIKATQKEAVQRRLLSLSEFMLAEGLSPEQPS